MSNVVELAKILWNYNVLNQKIKKADCIIALGNSDIRTAQTAASLMNRGYSGLLVTTGGFGRLTKDTFTTPEAQLFADEAIKYGVPSQKILIEDASTNTFDNFRFTKKLLENKALKPRSILVVTKPYMERRAQMTANAAWPEVTTIVTSPPLEFNNYTNEAISIELLVNMLVGDTQRLMIFSDSGHIPKQEFPDEVVNAYDELIKLGYTKQVIQSENIPNLLKAVTAGNTF
jgi:uncharacterized SAM-binding protein YcdF (DUF218 family)